MNLGSCIALHYNVQTKHEIYELIASLQLPKDYISIQLRGGDKIHEFSKLNDVDNILLQLDERKIAIENLFVFTDDYRYIEELREKRPLWKIYTLTNSNERGYYNSAFHRMCWGEKRKNMIKLFAMVEICIASNLHLGNEQTCVNQYIKSIKTEKSYLCVVDERNAKFTFQS